MFQNLDDQVGFAILELDQIATLTAGTDDRFEMTVDINLLFDALEIQTLDHHQVAVGHRLDLAGYGLCRPIDRTLPAGIVRGIAGGAMNDGRLHRVYGPDQRRDYLVKVHETS